MTKDIEKTLRGCFHPREGRVIDLSKKAFQDISSLEKGLTRVVIKVRKDP